MLLVVKGGLLLFVAVNRGHRVSRDGALRLDLPGSRGWGVRIAIWVGSRAARVALRDGVLASGGTSSATSRLQIILRAGFVWQPVNASCWTVGLRRPLLSAVIG